MKVMAALPLLWLYAGPPVFRPLSQGDPMAALDGSLDVWNVFRIIWWGVWGFVAFRGVMKRRGALRDLARSWGLLPFAVIALLLSFLASAAYSPAPIYTFGTAVFYGILVLAALDLSLRLHERSMSVRELLRGLLLVSLLLVFAIVAMHLTVGGAVSVVAAYGVRITGGTLGDFGTLSLVVVVAGLHVLTRTTGLAQSLHGFAVAFGIAAVGMSRTRSIMVAGVLGLLGYLLLRVGRGSRRATFATLAVVFLALSGGLAGALAVSLSGADAGIDEAIAFVVRDTASLQGFSGRDGISSVVLEASIANPLGLGYGAGPRVLLLNSERALANFGVVASRIGNAHNAYLEVLGGSGFVGFIAFLGIASWLLRRSFATRQLDAFPFVVLGNLMLVIGLVASTPVLPFTQSSALLWIAIAVLAGHGSPVASGSVRS